MASLDSLPADQRAVLDLVLQRGRSYDDIAALLAIDRAAVRARALEAFDQLGPDTGVPAEQRALITDYLLGQLPERVAEQTRQRLSESPGDRAWARVLASELAPVASKPLPEIPDGSGGSAAPPPVFEPQPDEDETPHDEDEPDAVAADGRRGPAVIGEPRPPRIPRRERERRPKRERTGSILTERPSSRLGGALVLLIGVAVVVVLVLVLHGGSKKHSSTTATSAASGSTTAAGSSTTGTSTTGTSTTGTSSSGTSTTATTPAQVVAQINLNPPSGSGSTKGVGFVVKDGKAYGIIIQAQKVAPNSHNAYAAWLSNSPADSERIGFVSPGVGKNGQLQTGGALPTNAGKYKELLLTLETSSNPKTPGTIVLEGPFKGVPTSS